MENISNITEFQREAKNNILGVMYKEFGILYPELSVYCHLNNEDELLIYNKDDDSLKNIIIHQEDSIFLSIINRTSSEKKLFSFEVPFDYNDIVEKFLNE